MHIDFLPHDAPAGRACLKLTFSPAEVAAELRSLAAGEETAAPAPAEDVAASEPGRDRNDPQLLKVADTLVNRGIEAAVRNHGFRPAGRISIRMDACSVTDGLSARLEAESLPDISFPASLEALSVRIEEAIPLKSEIHAMLERLRRSRGKLERVDERRLPEAGDVLALRLDGYREGAPVPGLHVESYLLNDANASRTPEIADVARTLHVGESGTCTLEDSPLFSPEDARVGKLEIRVTLCALMKEVLPDCDDAFARQCGSGSLEELRSALYRERMAFLIGRNRKRAEAALLEELLKDREFSVPPSILRAHERECLREAEAALRGNALSPADASRALEQKRPALLAEAARHARAQTWLMAFGYAHGLRVTEQELSARVGQMATALGRDAEALQKDFEATEAIVELQDRMLAEKALSMIYAKVRKITVDATGNEVRQTKK